MNAEDHLVSTRGTHATGKMSPAPGPPQGPMHTLFENFVPVLLEKCPSTRRYLGTRQPRFGQVLPEWLCEGFFGAVLGVVT